MHGVTISSDRVAKGVLLFVTLAMAACGDNGTEPPVAELDQQNLLDGSLGGQGIGIFVQNTGAPPGEYQDAQVFTVGITGSLASIRLPVLDANDVATEGVTVEVVRTSGGVPDDTEKLGEVSVPLSALGRGDTDAIRADPALWTVFDFSQQSIRVTAGEQLALIARSYSTGGIIYNPESTLRYTLGNAYRRDRLQGLPWNQLVDRSFGFQTWVFPD